jgi:hypothetical protein
MRAANDALPFSGEYRLLKYLNRKKACYFGRDGGEHVQHFPG